MSDPFAFELVSPEQLILSEPARQVVVPGSEGQFTVLIGHAPFMTTLRPGVVEATLASGEVTRIFVRGGFADTTPSRLTILAERAIDMKKLDRQMLAVEIKNAEDDATDATDPAVKDAAQMKLSQLREVEAALGAG